MKAQPSDLREVIDAHVGQRQLIGGAIRECVEVAPQGIEWKQVLSAEGLEAAIRAESAPPRGSVPQVTQNATTAGESGIRPAGIAESAPAQPHIHRWVGSGDYGDTTHGYMCGDCGIDIGDVEMAAQPSGDVPIISGRLPQSARDFEAGFRKGLEKAKRDVPQLTPEEVFDAIAECSALELSLHMDDATVVCDALNALLRSKISPSPQGEAYADPSVPRSADSEPGPGGSGQS
jgi:hypothetical protein